MDPEDTHLPPGPREPPDAPETSGAAGRSRAPGPARTEPIGLYADHEEHLAVARLDEVASALDEFDTPTEVAATFSTQRRIATGYFAVFLAVTLAVPTLSLTLGWWSQSRLVGGMSPSFVMAAGGLYAFFFGLAFAAASLAGAVEDRMLGGTQDTEPTPDEEMR